jgi:hypothetical protein
MPEYLLVLGGLGRIVYFLMYYAGHFVKFAWSVPFGLIPFGLGESFALNSDTMKDFRPWYTLQVPQYMYQMVNIVAIDRAEISQVECFE